MNLNKLFICGLICISSSAFAGISDVGNGGDIVACFDYAKEELYSLDYVLTKGRFTNDKVIKVSATFQSLERIENLIKAKVPSLLSSYSEFVDLIWNTNSGYNQIWIEGESPLNDIDDEKIHRVPTEICKPNMYSASKGELRQAIIRSKKIVNGTPKITYVYDKQILEYLNRKAPTQLSFLLVHEWLWSLNQQVDENRNINFFLHSDQFEKLSASEVKTRLSDLGLNLKN